METHYRRTFLSLDAEIIIQPLLYTVYFAVFALKRQTQFEHYVYVVTVVLHVCSLFL